jgi:hypothetical protein
MAAGLEGREMLRIALALLLTATGAVAQDVRPPPRSFAHPVEDTRLHRRDAIQYDAHTWASRPGRWQAQPQPIPHDALGFGPNRELYWCLAGECVRYCGRIDRGNCFKVTTRLTYFAD